MKTSTFYRLLATLIFSFLLVSFLPATVQAQATKTFTGTGNFSTAARWTGSTLPAAGDNLIIDGACTVDNSVVTDNVAYGTLVIGTATGRTLNWIASATNHLNVSNVSAGAAASILSMTNGGTLIIRGTWTSTNLTFTPGAGTIDIRSTMTLPAAYATYDNLTVNGSGTTVTAGVNTAVNNNLTVTSGTLNLGSFTANRASAGGTLTLANGAALKIGGLNTFPSNYSTHSIGATSTVEYSGTTQSVAVLNSAQDYGHLIISGSGTKTLAGAENVDGNFTLSAGTFTANNFDIIASGNWINNGTFTAGTGRVTFSGAGLDTVSGTSTTAFNTITINKGTDFTSSILDVQSLITMTAGGLTLTNGTFKLSSNSTITIFTADITVAPYLIPATAGLWVNGGTVSTTSDVTPAGLIRVSNGVLDVGNAIDARLLSSWATFIIEGGVFNISGRLTRRITGEGHYFTMSGGTFTVATMGNTNATYGPFTMDDPGSSFTMSGGTIIVSKSGGTAPVDYTNLAGTTNITGGTLQIGDASTPVSDVMLINSTTPLWDLVINGTNSPQAELVTNPLVVENDVTITSGTLNGNSLNITVGGDWTNNVSTSAFTAGTATVTLNGTNAESVAGSFATTFYNLTIASGNTVTSNVNCSISNNLLVSSGTLNLGSFTANRASAGGTLTVSNGAALKIGGTNTLPSNYSTHSIGATSTIEYSGTTQSVVALNSAQNYGHLIISGSGTKTLAGAENVGGNLTISAGTFNLGANTINRSVAGGTLTISAGAALKIGGTNTLPSNYSAHSIASTGTIEYSGTTQSVAVLNSSQDYGNLIISGSGTKTLAGTENVAGDLTISAGTFDLGSFTINRTSAGAGTLSVTGSATLKIGGTNTFPSNYLTHSITGISTVEYSGTNQSVVVLNSAQDYQGLTISGSGTKTLAGNVNVFGTLTLTNGTVTTGSNTLYVKVSGIVNRTSGYVIGNLKRGISTGSPTRIFDVGDATNYTPITFVFASITTAGDLTVSTTSGDHANIGTSTIDGAKSVNRTWTLTNSGIVFATYGATFTFVASDVDGSANTSAFIVGRYSAGWTYPTVGTKTTLTTQTTGLVAFGDFQLGELGVAKTWDGGAGTNNWGDAVNWNPDGVPASTDNVNLTGANTININVAAVANDLLLNNAGLVLTINSGSSLAATTDLSLTAGTLNMGSNVISGAGSFTLGSGGNLGIGSTTGITSSGATGNVQVSGIRTFSTAGNYNYNGTSAQVTGNGLPATINNITIGNSAGVTLSAGLAVSSNLTVTSGSTFDLGSFTANRATAGGTLSVASGATLKIGGTNTLPSNYSTHSINATSTAEYSGTNQSVAVLNSSQAYGNLIISGSGTKTPAGTISVQNITIQSGTSLTVTATTLQIAASISNSGTFTVSNGTIEFNGSSTQTIPNAVFAGNKILNLIISNNVTLAGQDSVTGVLSFGNVNSKTFSTGGYLTLKSTVAGTASLADITNNSINTGNAISGNVTVERFLTSYLNRAYRLLGPSVTTATSIHANWQEGATSNINNPTPNYGTQITGTTVDQTNGFDGTTTGQGSMFTYNPVTSAWVAEANTNSAILNALTGYLLYIRGDRSINLGAQGTTLPSVVTTLRATGTLLTGTQTFSGLQGNGNFNLITNPFASSINWATVQAAATGVTNAYSFWDPNFGARGGFVTVNTSGVASSGNATQNIQSGQAFFVQASGVPAPTVTVRETDKSSANNIDVFSITYPLQAFSTSLYFTQVDGTPRIADGVVTVYNNSYSASVDANDAEEINNWDENIAIAREGKHLSIESRPVITGNDTLPLFMNNMKVKDYSFIFAPSNLNLPGTSAELVDNFTRARTAISLTDSTTIPFTVSAAAGSNAQDRFYIVFTPLKVLPVTLTNLKAYQQGANIAVEWKVENELNMKQYEVERSVDGINFIKMSAVLATGSPAYKWPDVNPAKGNNFYRIKSIDVDSHSTYSMVVNVNITKGKQSITIYPNPVENKVISLSMENIAGGIYYFKVINEVGQLITKRSLTHDAGTSVELISLNKNMAAGNYLLQLTAPDGNEMATKFSIE